MLTSGFYNSKGGDRKYDAEQFGAMFNGLITDGVFAHYKDALKVTAGSGNRDLVIKPGRAWFNGTWTEVDDNGHSIYLMGSAVEATYFVYLAVNKFDRKNTIAWYSSIANNDPEKGLYFYLLAQVTVPGGATKISDSMITDTRGSDLCPYVTGIMETVSFEEIVKRVCGDNWQDWLGAYEAGITTGVQTAVATSERAMDEVKSLKAYAVESEAVSYIWAKFEAVPTGGGGFEWATDAVHTELSDPPMPMFLFKDLSYADLGPGFKPNVALNSSYIAEGEAAAKAIPAVTQSKVWREYPYFWEGGADFGTEVLRYDDLQRVVVNVGGIVSEKYRYRVSRLMHIPVVYEPGAYIGTVSADNATAYPRDGYKDGYYYMRFAARAEDVSFYYPGLSAKTVRDAIIEVVKTGGNGSGSAMSVIEVEELPPTGIKGAFYIVKKPDDTDASEYLWLDRWEKVGSTNSGQNVDLTGYAKEQWVQNNYQPKGDYLTAVPIATTEKLGGVKPTIAKGEGMTQPVAVDEDGGLWTPAGASGTVLVAASDAPDIIKAAAQYVCTGVNDQMTINAAIQAVGKGEVRLSGGNYYITAEITLIDDITLTGRNAIINVCDEISSAISQAYNGGDTVVHVEDASVFVAGQKVSTDVGGGVKFENYIVGVDADANTVTLDKPLYTSVVIEANTGRLIADFTAVSCKYRENVIVDGLIVNSNGETYTRYDTVWGSNGIEMYNSTNCKAINCTVRKTRTHGIAIFGSTACTVTNCRVEDCYELGIDLSNGQNGDGGHTISATTVSGTSGRGIQCHYAKHVNVVGCSFFDNGTGAGTQGSGQHVIFSGCNFFGNGMSIYCNSTPGRNVIISGNVIGECNSGIQFDSVEDASITGNIFYSINSYAIALINSSHAIVANNKLYDVYTGDTDTEISSNAAIRLSRSSSYCLIMGNNIEISATATKGCACGIAESNMQGDCNVVTGNVIRGARIQATQKLGANSKFENNYEFA